MWLFVRYNLTKKEEWVKLASKANNLLEGEQEFSVSRLHWAAQFQNWVKS